MSKINKTARLLKRSTFESLITEMNDHNVMFEYFDSEATLSEIEYSNRMFNRLLKKHHWTEDEFYDELEKRQDESDPP